MKFKLDVKTDFELMKIPIKECNERLVNIRDYSKDIFIELEKESKSFQKICEDCCLVRESVAIMLSQAQSLLPECLFLKVIDGFRPMEAQKKIYRIVFDEMRKEYPLFNKEKLELKTDKYVANPKTIPPHTTGGAVDLVLVNGNKQEINMGTKINTSSIEAATYYPDVSDDAKKNRSILINVMTKVGFANYPLEWWHWSYGDRTWAYYKKKKFALYGGTKLV